MAMLMGPPMLPGFSLRVQLYSPYAHTPSDKPVRCFRVVALPAMTIREFCQEASRIHQINYGEPLSIKKCQDDQEFDVTQSEVIGSLFPNAATIRIIQASATPGVRDSVPPSSALRYDPRSSTYRKRDREESSRPNVSGPPSPWKSSKRQRLERDPDEPHPSREADVQLGGAAAVDGNDLSSTIIPNSQQNDRFLTYNELPNSSRHVRTDIPRIPETPSPSPSPPPALRDPECYENGSTDHKNQKPATPNMHDQHNFVTPANVSGLEEGSVEPQSHVPILPRSRSSSNHIPKAAERGISVSTAGTSAFSPEEHLPQHKIVEFSNSRKTSNQPSNVNMVNGKLHSRSPDEDSIYENIESDGEGSAILRRTKTLLKSRSSSNSNSTGLDWAKKFNTPPIGSRRSPHSFGQTSGALPLTPSSREHGEKQPQRREPNDANNTGVVAAQAEEQRRSKTEVGRQVEEVAQASEMERSKSKRDELHQGEGEEIATVTAHGQRVENEHNAEAKKLDDERNADEKRLDLARVRKEIEARQLLERQKAKAEEAKRLRGEDKALDRARQTAVASGELKKSKKITETSKGKTLELKNQAEQEQSSILPGRRATPNSSVRLNSSTPLIPSGRKTAIKSITSSSQAAASSSPAIAKSSPAIPSKGVGIEAQMPLPKKRRVSFVDQVSHMDTPSQPQSIKAITPQTSSISKPNHLPSATPKSQTSKASTTRTSNKLLPEDEIIPILKQQPDKASKPKLLGRRSSNGEINAKLKPVRTNLAVVVPPEKQSKTPIPLPPTVKWPIAERSITPMMQAKVIAPSLGSCTNPPTKKITAHGVAASNLAPTNASYMKFEASKRSRMFKEKSKSVEPPPVEPPHALEISSDDSDSEDIPNRPAKAKATPTTATPPENRSYIQNLRPETEKDHNRATAEMARENSSVRESRSPVFFNQHATPILPTQVSQSARPLQPVPSASRSATSDEEGDNSNSEDDASSSEEEDVEDQDGMDAQKLSPELPRIKANDKLSATNPANQRKMMEEDLNIQDEVDQQLTSTMYEVRPMTTTPIPPPSSISTTRPKFKFGASLQSLNSNKPVYGRSVASAQVNGRSSQAALNSILSDEESSDEETENSSSNSSIEDDENPHDKINATELQSRQSPSSQGESSDESEGTSSDDDNGSIMAQMRNELAAEIAEMANGQPQLLQNGLPSPKRALGTQSALADGSKKGKPRKVASRAAGKDLGTKKLDRTIVGYHFTQPV